MKTTLDDAHSRVWGPYGNYQDEVRFEYGRRMWRIPEMRARLLGHRLDERHPWRERFIERRPLPPGRDRGSGFLQSTPIARDQPAVCRARNPTSLRRFSFGQQA